MRRTPNRSCAFPFSLFLWDRAYSTWDSLSLRCWKIESRDEKIRTRQKSTRVLGQAVVIASSARVDLRVYRTRREAAGAILAHACDGVRQMSWAALVGTGRVHPCGVAIDHLVELWQSVCAAGSGMDRPGGHCEVDYTRYPAAEKVKRLCFHKSTPSLGVGVCMIPDADPCLQLLDQPPIELGRACNMPSHTF